MTSSPSLLRSDAGPQDQTGPLAARINRLHLEENWDLAAPSATGSMISSLGVGREPNTQKRSRVTGLRGCTQQGMDHSDHRRFLGHRTISHPCTGIHSIYDLARFN